MALSTTSCSYTTSIGCRNAGNSILDNLAMKSDTSGNPNRRNLATRTIGKMIPRQFGYRVEVSYDNGHSWESVYDTSRNLEGVGGHAAQMKKLSVSSQVLSFAYDSPGRRPTSPPFFYLSCHGEGATGSESPGASVYGYPITCGDSLNVYPNLYGSTGGAGSEGLVPKINAKIVRLTVFI